MPTFRSRTILPARLMLAAAVCFAAFAAPPTKTFRAAACPVEPPMPLRALYAVSERVAAARAVSTRVVPGEYAQHQRRTVFEVTESLKGDPGENRLEVLHWVTGDADPDNFRKGEPVLLFLRPVEEGGGYQITDARYGAKRLSEEALALYVKRIKELQYILAQPELDKRELTEWLVRCAEEPATRWEGAYELLRSQTAADYEAEQRKEREANAAASAAAPAPEAAPEDAAADVIHEEIVTLPGIYEQGIDGSIVNGLTAEQRRRLADALFASEKVGEGEIHLVRLVGSWGDERLAPYAIRYLRGVEQDPPYEASEMVSALAHALKDETLVELSDEYAERASYFDEPEEETADAEEESEETEESGGEEPEAESGEESGEEAEEEATPRLLTTLHAPDGTKLNATQRRSQMLRNFLAAVDGRLSERALSALRP